MERKRIWYISFVVCVVVIGCMIVGSKIFGSMGLPLWKYVLYEAGIVGAWLIGNSLLIVRYLKVKEKR